MGSIATNPNIGRVQHEFIARALIGKFLVMPYEVNAITKEELRRLVLEGKLVSTNGGWTTP